MCAVRASQLDERSINDVEIQQAVRFVEAKKAFLTELVGQGAISSFEEAIVIYNQNCERLDFPDEAIAAIATSTVLNTRQLLFNVEGAEASEAEKAELKGEIEKIRDRVGKLEGVKDALTMKNTELEGQVYVDDLTKAFNPRGFEKHKGPLFDECRKAGRPMSCAFIDLDHFKSFNDTYGHQIGNKALEHFSKTVCEALRGYDVPFRGEPYGTKSQGAFARKGGEEFVILMPYSTAEEAAVAAERIRKKLEETPLEVTNTKGDTYSLNITCSIGIATTLNSDQNVDSVIEASDWAMQAAKDKEVGGRNMVVVANRGEGMGTTYQYYSDIHSPDRRILPPQERGAKIQPSTEKPASTPS